jgi:hypothetical protein
MQQSVSHNCSYYTSKPEWANMQHMYEKKLLCIHSWGSTNNDVYVHVEACMRTFTYTYKIFWYDAARAWKEGILNMSSLPKIQGRSKYVCICTYVWKCLHVCVCDYAVHTYKTLVAAMHLCMCIYILIYIYMYVCLDTMSIVHHPRWQYMYMYMYMYINNVLVTTMYLYACTHIHTYIYIFACMHCMHVCIYIMY